MIHMHPKLVAALDAGDLPTALQTAIKLEHATIPTYLFAMFSIRPGSNTSIENLISSIVIEEMLHMSLACNILNAIGGSPVIDEPGFIPDYPTPLPGTIEEGLIVPLAPLSLDLVKNVFMVIEKPEDPHDYPVLKATADVQEDYKTIGQFYGMIKTKLKEAGPGIWVGDQSKQVTFQYMPELTEVYDYATAEVAINLIVEQGEGTTQDNPMEPGSDTEPAHYYRFGEIANQATLQKNPNPPPNPKPEDLYFYGKPDIPFVSAGVYPTKMNPKASDYKVGTQARYACDNFNYTYTTLLKCLHATFNGNPAQLNDAIGLMESLKEQAVTLMAIKLDDGTTAGPSFEYQPTNPWSPTS
jgi:ferritin-like protein